MMAQTLWKYATMALFWLEEAKLISELAEKDAINYGLFKQAYDASLDKFLDEYVMSKFHHGLYDIEGACVNIIAGSKGIFLEVNQAEAEFWRKSEGYRVGWADEILGFDCGGLQWVSETCFPAGTFAKPSMKDLEYIEELKKLIEKEEVPAPAPIEQRWSARSQSPMSPAYSSAENDIFSWVGIIMYLPTMDARQRKEITEDSSTTGI
ncbi:hypothetical protein Q3G72_006690 [Acer saccharum]|nr:hypothetical protein Q3G72_006690 [Acer saccharum]